MALVFAYIEMNHYIFVSRVGLVSKCIGQGDVELIRFDKDFLFLLLQASFCCLHYKNSFLASLIIFCVKQGKQE